LQQYGGKLWTKDGFGAKGIKGRVKFLLLAWTRILKTSYRKNSTSLGEKTLLLAFAIILSRVVSFLLSAFRFPCCVKSGYYH